MRRELLQTGRQDWGYGGGQSGKQGLKTISVSLNKLEQEGGNLVDKLLRTNTLGAAFD